MKPSRIFEPKPLNHSGSNPAGAGCDATSRGSVSAGSRRDSVSSEQLTSTRESFRRQPLTGSSGPPRHSPAKASEPPLLVASPLHSFFEDFRELRFAISGERMCYAVGYIDLMAKIKKRGRPRIRTAEYWREYYTRKQREWRAAHPRIKTGRKQRPHGVMTSARAKR
jgi:hypothetical protein